MEALDRQSGAGPNETGEDTAPPVVAFQGEAGAFSEEALFTHFGEGAHTLPCRNFRQVGEAVMQGTATFGVLPVENTLAGSVQGAYDVLIGGGLEITGEIVIPIRHHLLGVPRSSLEEVRKVISHPVALAQCTDFLSKRPQMQAVAVYDTAGAAQQVSKDGDPTVAAIASRGAAERYSLELLAEEIQDRDDNQTRFFVIRKGGSRSEEKRDPALSYKTVVVLELRDQPGSLLQVLEPFAERGIDLSKLESRPATVPWRYRFILELRADMDTPEAEEAVEEARRRTSVLAVLGSFPAARTRKVSDLD